MARILLVDDDIAEISAVKRVLARGGHQPVLATNAVDALAAVARSRPDLLVVAAACEGGEALRRFTSAGGGHGVPLLVLGEASAAPSGAGHVDRPVDPGQLAEVVAAALAQAARAGPPAGAPEPGAPGSELDAPPAAGDAAPRSSAETGSRAAGAPAGASAAESRRAAAEALRARAEELRRASAPPAPPAAEEEDPGLEAILRRAEEAERSHAAAQLARAREAERARALADERRTREAEERVRARKAEREREARAAEEREREARAAEAERARLEEERRVAAERAARERAEASAAAARAERERAAAAERAERALAGERARAAEETRARAAEARERAAAAERTRAAAEARSRALGADEARASVRAAEEARPLDEQRREADPLRERDALDEDARRRLEAELAELHAEVEAERRPADERLAPRADPTDARRAAEEESRRHAEEEELRAAIASARAEMEALRRRSEDEARRRAQAEAAVARLEQEAARRDDADRRVQDGASLHAPLALPVYRPPAEEPRPDPAEEAARRRVAAARERERERTGAGAGAARVPDASVASERPAAPPPQALRAGTLSELPAPRLLALAARADVTGRLDVEGATARSIWLERGRVVGATSADPGDRVEELALRLGLVTREQHRQIATAAATLSARRCALLLVERGFLKPSELTALVRRRTEEVVFGAFGDGSATFRLAAAEVPAEERIQLDRSTLALAVEGVRRRWLAPRVDAVLGGAGTLLAPVADGPSNDELGLSQEERRALALADGLRTVDEVVAASPLDALSTRQVLAALVLVGSLAVRVFQEGRQASAATSAIDLARVWDKLEQARRADYFTILGVSRHCTPHEVREAAERLSTELDPARFAGIDEEGLAARLEEILGVVADAREILVDDRLRAEYLGGLGE